MAAPYRPAPITTESTQNVASPAFRCATQPRNRPDSARRNEPTAIELGRAAVMAISLPEFVKGDVLRLHQLSPPNASGKTSYLLAGMYPSLRPQAAAE